MKMLINLNSYYLYEHLLPETEEVFYVGMGKSVRPFETRGVKRSAEWFEKAKNGFVVQIIDKFDTKAEACKAEIAQIKFRRELGYNLVNKTDGGQGALGTKPWNAGKTGVFSKDVIEKISAAGIKRFSNEREREKHSLRTGGKPFQAIKDGFIVWEGVIQNQCAKDLGLDQRNISRCLRLGGTHKGYIFSYLDTEPKK